MNTGQLERRLIDWIEEFAEEHDAGIHVGGSFARDMRAALFTTALDSEERSISSRWRANGDVHQADQFIANRVERVLRQAMARIFAPSKPPEIPMVVVRRGVDPEAIPSPDEDHTAGGYFLVLADHEAHASLSPVARLSRRSPWVSEAIVGARRIDLIEAHEGLLELASVLESVALKSDSGLTIGDVAHEDPGSLVGALLSRKYLLTDCLGLGGFGAVYQARDLFLDKTVAIKVLHGRRSKNPEDLRSFKEEARRVTRLSHPNVVEWKAFDETEDGTCYFVMELLQGRSLREAIDRDAPFRPRWVERILGQILSALRCAHEVEGGEPILHLDLKPQNILLVPDRGMGGHERVKVIDFGIGRIQRGETHRAGRTAGLGDPTVDIRSEEIEPTREPTPRATACTPEYAAPELCAHLLPGPAAALDPRTDIYSVGVLGYEMLTGRQPIEVPPDRTDLLRIKQDIDLPPLAVLSPRMPRSLARFLDRCLKRDRQLRWKCAAEALEALRRIETRRRRIRFTLIAGPLVAMTIIGARFLLPGALRPPLTLLSVEEGVARPIEGGHIYLGPERDTTTLRVDGLSSEEIVTEAGVVHDRSEEAVPLEGCSLIWQEGNVVDLRFLGGETRFHTSFYLRVDEQGGETRYSTPLELVWLGRLAVEIQELALPLDDQRALDPEGRSARIQVRANEDDVEAAWIAVEDETALAQRSVETQGSDALSFLAPLTGLLEQPGSVKLTANVRDRAGGVAQLSRRMDVVLDPLRIRSAYLDCLKIGNVYSISPDDPISLVIEPNGKADVSWLLHTSDGRVIPGGSVSMDGTGRLVLGDLADMCGGRSFSGWIEVQADDLKYVNRQDPMRSRDSIRIPVEFIAGSPRLSVQVKDPEGSQVELTDGQPLYLSSADFSVRVQRESEHPMSVEVLLHLPEDPQSSSEASPRRLLDPLDTEETFVFEEVEEGAYDLEVHAWRTGEGREDQDREPDLSIGTRLTIDRSDPVLELVEKHLPLVIQGRGEEALPRIRLIESGSELQSSPVVLHWHLRASGWPGWLAEGALGRADHEADVPLPTASGGRGTQPMADGRYVLVVSAVDLAGNEARPLEIPYEVSMEGPEIQLVEPLPGGTWNLTFTGRLLLWARALDPNGVSSVKARIGLTGSEEVVVDLEREADDWKGSILVPLEWAGLRVGLHLVATDECGTEGLRDEELELSPLTASLPPIVDVSIGTGDVTSMRLVRGNKELPYIFGGRSDDQENRLFEAAGLRPFDALSTERSWTVTYKEGEISDFYLDEHEVTVGQFLRFAGDPGSWQTPGIWEGSGPPGEGRRAEIVRYLSGVDERYPVTGVDWAEARAYALFVGKRLPSVVEWEYAVRGGARYRPYPAYSGPSGPGAADSENGGLHAVQSGEDVTADTGLWGLASNAQEWTSTPVSFERDSSVPLALAPYLANHAKLLLDPIFCDRCAQSPQYWVVGAGHGDSRCDFSSLDTRARESRIPELGFRCAASAATLLEILRTDSNNGPRFLPRGE